MIGNDIVDLNFAHINSRWREQRFLDKLYTQSEQSFILDNHGYSTMWRLWSMKESAYKIWARDKSSRFNPKFFSCHIICETTGSVFFDGHTVNTSTTCSSDVIYTTAQLKNAQRISELVVFEDIEIIEKQSLLRQKAIEAYSDLKSIPKEYISIEKNEFGVPQFIMYQNLQPNALTLTHHGQYGGFAISY